MATVSNFTQLVITEGTALYRYIDSKMSRSLDKHFILKPDGIFKSRYDTGEHSALYSKVHELVVAAFKRNGYRDARIVDEIRNGDRNTYFEATNLHALKAKVEEEFAIQEIAQNALQHSRL